MASSTLRYVLRILYSFDQFVNTLLGGRADHTISGRVGYHAKRGGKFALFCERVIDGIFFGKRTTAEILLSTMKWIKSYIKLVQLTIEARTSFDTIFLVCNNCFLPTNKTTFQVVFFRLRFT